jgi:hypothetical protein
MLESVAVFPGRGPIGRFVDYQPVFWPFLITGIFWKISFAYGFVLGGFAVLGAVFWLRNARHAAYLLHLMFYLSALIISISALFLIDALGRFAYEVPGAQAEVENSLHVLFVAVFLPLVLLLSGQGQQAAVVRYRVMVFRWLCAFFFLMYCAWRYQSSLFVLISGLTAGVVVVVPGGLSERLLDRLLSTPGSPGNGSAPGDRVVMTPFSRSGVPILVDLMAILTTLVLTGAILWLQQFG